MMMTKFLNRKNSIEITYYILTLTHFIYINLLFLFSEFGGRGGVGWGLGRGGFGREGVQVPPHPLRRQAHYCRSLFRPFSPRQYPLGNAQAYTGILEVQKFRKPPAPSPLTHLTLWPKGELEVETCWRARWKVSVVSRGVLSEF